MATKTLKDMKNELDDDVLEDIAAISSDKGKQSRLNSLKTAVSGGIKGLSGKLFGSKKAIIITAGGAVLFISLVAAGIIFLGKGTEEMPEKAKDAHPDVAVKEQEAKKPAPPVIVESVFDDIVVLNPFDHIPLKPDQGSAMRNITLNLSLELSDSRYKKEVYGMEEKIRQIIEDRIGGLTWLELRTPEGKIMLKYELLKQINAISSEAVIRNIYFTNFLMQR